MAEAKFEDVHSFLEHGIGIVLDVREAKDWRHQRISGTENVPRKDNDE